MIYFSCIVTCFNRQDTILDSLNSILNQDYPHFEIIVIDDYSIDDSVKVIESLNNNKIKVIKHKENLGQNAALNTGVNNSKYDFLAFLDSDDFWLPQYLSEMANVYENNPNIGFAYCSLTTSAIWTLQGENKYAETLNQGFLSSMISITAKKECIIDIGLFDLKYRICQDDDFCFRLAKKYSFCVIEKQLAKIGGTFNSMTRNKEEVAKGWAFLFENYKFDIVKYCGGKSYSRHLINVAIKFAKAGNFLFAIKYYMKSIVYFFKKSENKFDFDKTEFFKLSKILFQCIFDIKNFKIIIKKWLKKLNLKN